MNQCLLPVDWLDFLEGKPSAATRAHLDTCMSCRTLVQELKSQVVDAAPLSAQVPDEADRAACASSLTGGHAPEQAHPGQIWWTASTADVSDRLPVVVLRVFDEAGRSWADVAPLWIDEDAATSTDVLLTADDSTTGVPWRVAFRHQTVVARSQLDGFLGVLTPSGAALLEQALAGTIPSDRRGTDLESAHDPRLAGDAWLADAVLTLGRQYAALFAFAISAATALGVYGVRNRP